MKKVVLGLVIVGGLSACTSEDLMMASAITDAAGSSMGASYYDPYAVSYPQDDYYTSGRAAADDEMINRLIAAGGTGIPGYASTGVIDCNSQSTKPGCSDFSHINVSMD